MVHEDPNHKHQYDAAGRQLCCTQEEKIYTQAGAKELLQKGHSHDDGHNHDGHDHDHESSGRAVQQFLPAIISFVLLMLGLAFDNNWLPRPVFFKEYIRLGWYIAAYLPVGIPVMREMLDSIAKKEIFSEFTLMVLATVGAFAIGEYPEGVAVMLFYAVGEVFQTLAVKRAKANIKSLLDQRPDEVTVLEHNQQKQVHAKDVSIGSIS